MIRVVVRGTVTLLLCVAVFGCGADFDVPTEPVASSPGSSPPNPAPTTADVRHPVESLTPGRTFPGFTRKDACTPGWSAAHRERLTVADERDVLAGYGLPTAWATTRAWPRGPISEWDHLIPLVLGGSNSTENIWPMTDHEQDQRKDRLENRLHREVCDGTITLQQAWRQARTFWSYW